MYNKQHYSWIDRYELHLYSYNNLVTCIVVCFRGIMYPINTYSAQQFAYSFLVKLSVQIIQLFLGPPPFLHSHLMPSRPNWRHTLPKRAQRPTPLGPTTSLHAPVSSKRHLLCAFRTLASRRKTNTTWRHLNNAMVVYRSVTERKFKHRIRAPDNYFF